MRGPKPQPILRRFENKFQENAVGCWEWESSSEFRISHGTKRGISPARLAYLLRWGEIPEGNRVSRTCWNTKCVNPDHLTLGKPPLRPKDPEKEQKARKRAVVYTMEWIKRNPEKRAEHSRLRYQRHKEECDAAGRRWREANPEKVKAFRERARERHRVLHPPQEKGNYKTRPTPKRLKIYERDQGKCQICYKEVAFEDMTLDHIVPQSRGGGHEPTNLRVAHLKCNYIRSNHGPAQLRIL